MTEPAPDDGIDHGASYRSYQQCRRHYGRACRPCRAACAAYQRDYRKRRPDVDCVHAHQQKVRDRALRELARRHPTELADLIAELHRLHPTG